MQIGRVQSIHRFPVKSMCGEDLEHCEVGAEGLAGDRAFALRDEAAREIRGGKRLPRLMLCTARYPEEPSLAGITHARHLLRCVPDPLRDHGDARRDAREGSEQRLGCATLSSELRARDPRRAARLGRSQLGRPCAAHRRATPSMHRSRTALQHGDARAAGSLQRQRRAANDRARSQPMPRHVRKRAAARPHHGWRRCRAGVSSTSSRGSDEAGSSACKCDAS